MTKAAVLMLYSLLVSFVIMAQTEDEIDWAVASKQERAYSFYRNEITKPSYGIAKIERLINKVRPKDLIAFGVIAINYEDYSSLTLREKLKRSFF